MADYTISITNEIYTYGPEPSLFGQAVFGVDTFGNDLDDLDVLVGKFIDNSISMTTIIMKKIKRLISLGSLLVDDDNDVTYAEYVSDGAGWYYDYIDRTRNAENRKFTTWTES